MTTKTKKKGLDTVTVSYQGQILVCHGIHIPSHPGIHTRSNGDPGDPPIPSEFVIRKVMDITDESTEEDITLKLDDKDFNSLEELCLEKLD